MSRPRLPGPLATPEWLMENLAHPKLIVLDASLAAPANKQAAEDSSLTAQIPGTRVFDFDKKICDRGSALPHMMPSAELFTSEVRALGVDRDSVIVVYDRQGVYSSPRARWMFKAMGHDEVAVLDGGFPGWLDKGFRCEDRGVEARKRGDFAACPKAGLFCDANAVAEAMDDAASLLVDARPEGRFFGREPEPRQGLRGGHIPGAKNVPFKLVLSGTRLRAPGELRSLLRGRLVVAEKKLIFSCGSGVTACIPALAAEVAGYPDIAVYDGSWSEWGLPSARPVSTK